MDPGDDPNDGWQTNDAHTRPALELPAVAPSAHAKTATASGPQTRHESRVAMRKRPTSRPSPPARRPQPMEWPPPVGSPHHSLIPARTLPNVTCRRARNEMSEAPLRRPALLIYLGRARSRKAASSASSGRGRSGPGNRVSHRPASALMLAAETLRARSHATFWPPSSRWTQCEAEWRWTWSRHEPAPSTALADQQPICD